MRAIVVALAAVLLPPAGAASADVGADPRLKLVITPVAVPFDSGYLVTVTCHAEAAPETPADVPVATSVSCSVGGVSAGRSMPGASSYVVVSNSVPGSPYTVCISGQTAFVNPVEDDVVLVSDGPYCEPVPV